jgi:hypothetical protein
VALNTGVKATITAKQIVDQKKHQARVRTTSEVPLSGFMYQIQIGRYNQIADEFTVFGNPPVLRKLQHYGVKN